MVGPLEMHVGVRMRRFLRYYFIERVVEFNPDKGKVIIYMVISKQIE